ncbi:hypothetical protein [Streptomyces sp. NPDC047706]|uniref:hypothetical protein n=1 Tax=Streptomyces sp. NPDC047706 TaxID=3365486 RepID=UPI0037115523
MIRIGIILGGTRPGRNGEAVAKMADVRSQVALSLFNDFEDFSEFRPGDFQVEALNTMLDQVPAWSQALAPLRAA